MNSALQYRTVISLRIYDNINTYFDTNENKSNLTKLVDHLFLSLSPLLLTNLSPAFHPRSPLSYEKSSLS